MTTTSPALIAVYAYPNNGYSPASNLVVGKSYVVRKVEAGRWSTDIYLEGVRGIFSSVQFAFFENGKPVSIFNSHLYNS